MKGDSALQKRLKYHTEAGYINKLVFNVDLKQWVAMYQSHVQGCCMPYRQRQQKTAYHNLFSLKNCYFADLSPGLV